MAEKARKELPVSERQKDYFADKNRTDTSGWISGARAFLWIVFILWIILGLTIGLPLSKYSPWLSVAAIFGLPIIDFLTVSLFMIFLDMAEDKKAIRNQLSNK